MVAQMSDAEYIQRLEAELLEMSNRLERQTGLLSGALDRAGLRANYYRSLVLAVGEALGPIAYICDDGSISQEVLCAKVPELVAAVMQRLKEPAPRLTLFEGAAMLEEQQGSVLISPTPVEEKK